MKSNSVWLKAIKRGDKVMLRGRKLEYLMPAGLRYHNIKDGLSVLKVKDTELLPPP